MLLERRVVEDLEVVRLVDVPVELVVVHAVLAEVRHERRLGRRPAPGATIPTASARAPMTRGSVRERRIRIRSPQTGQDNEASRDRAGDLTPAVHGAPRSRRASRAAVRVQRHLSKGRAPAVRPQTFVGQACAAISRGHRARPEVTLRREVCSNVESARTGDRMEQRAGSTRRWRLAALPSSWRPARPAGRRGPARPRPIAPAAETLGASLDFTLKDMNGKDVRLADFKGRPAARQFLGDLVRSLQGTRSRRSSSSSDKYTRQTTSRCSAFRSTTRPTTSSRSRRNTR